MTTGPADARLGEQDDLVPVRAVEQVADDLLGRATGIPVRGVDEGAARSAERAEEVPRVLRGGAGAPGHRAEAEPGHGEAGGSQAAREHGGDPIPRGAVATV